MDTKKLVKLFEPFKIKNVILKNRMVKSSQGTWYAEADGSIGETIKQFYATIAKGGVGLLIIEESACEHPIGQSKMPHIRVDDDKFIAGLKQLADAVHQHGCPVFVQITHAGPAHFPFDGQQPGAPSSIDPPAEPAFAVSRELTIPEIKDKVERYAQAALRVRKAGFDGCEIHLAHYALGNSFLSRIQNKRMDEYGCQTLENRARFGCEILRRTRELVGSDFVVGVRMSAREFGHPLGTTNEEAVEFAKMFEKAGADYIQSSGYGYNEFYHCWAPDHVAYPDVPKTAKSFCADIPKGALLSYAANIKKAVSIPVSGVGRLDYENGEKALEEGVVDLIWLGRRLMTDPAYPQKVREGRFDDIRHCTACMYCVDLVFKGEPMRCRWNPYLGRECELGDGIDFEPAKKKKKVMVIGAGPAGMEAARVAALRGHDVQLYDKGKTLGGLMPLAAFIKGTEFDDVSMVLKWYETQISMTGVQVTFGKEVDAKVVEKEKPDVVVLAPGSQFEVPDIPGIKNPNVVTTSQLKNKAETYIKYLGSGLLSSLSKIHLPLGKRVIVVGGDLKGLEAAEFLVKRGKEVTIVDEAQDLGEGMYLPLKVKLLPWMQAKGVVIFSGVLYEEITPEGLTIITKEGKRKKIKADTVLIIEKGRKNVKLYKALVEKVSEIYLIGDAKDDKHCWFAGSIYDGARIGTSI